MEKLSQILLFMFAMVRTGDLLWIAIFMALIVSILYVLKVLKELSGTWGFIPGLFIVAVGIIAILTIFK